MVGNMVANAKKINSVLNDIVPVIFKDIPQNITKDLQNTLQSLLTIAYNTSISISALGQSFNLINHSFVNQFRDTLLVQSPTQGIQQETKSNDSNGLAEQSVNNYTPICASVQNPNIPLYEPKTIIAFKNLKARLKTQKQEDDVLKQLNDIANLSAQEHGEYIDSFMKSHRITEKDCKREKLPSVLIGQNGVYAVKDIPVFSVLGYYSGLYFLSTEELVDYGTKNGLAFKTYMFSLPDVTMPRISGYLHGNALSLVNAGTIYSGTAHQIAREIHEKCNLTVIYAKSLEYPDKDYVNDPEKYDLVAYATNRPIKKGEQLFVNYGMNYWKNKNDNFTTATEDEIREMMSHFHLKSHKNFQKVYKKK
jgi:hypothetical protein